MDCIFCAILSGQLPSTRVYEDETTLAIMDINPATRGHSLVLPKAHHRDLLDLPPNLWAHLAQVAQTVAKGAKLAFQCEGINLLQTTGHAAFQRVFHFHLHVIPRWRSDGIVAPWKMTRGNPEEIRLAGDALRSVLSA